MEPRLTLLNTMAGREFGPALDRHLAWGITHLDLKGGIFGKEITRLTDTEATEAASMIRARSMSVYCLSSTLFYADVELGEREFVEQHLKPLEILLRVAETLDARVIRLIAATSRRRPELEDGVAYAVESHPWLLDLYREAVWRIHDAGFTATIENEKGGCLLASPGEVRSFFEAVAPPEGTFFTWDAVNMWQAGTFPSIGVYEGIRPLLGYYHVKGGRSEPGEKGGGPLRWKSSLEEASWPVAEITRRIVRDRACPFICLNPSHGEPGADWTGGDAAADLRFLARMLHEETGAPSPGSETAVTRSGNG